MTELFLNKELSLLAKEKGFDEPCFRIHIDIHKNNNWRLLSWGEIRTYQTNEDKLSPVRNSWVAKHDYIAVCAPLYDQILNWFYDKHKISIEAMVAISGRWAGYITINKGNVQGCPMTTSHVPSKRELLNDLIKEAFKLI